MDTRRASLIFDLDGTLIDSLPGIEFSVRTAFAERGIPRNIENLRNLIGPPIRTIFAKMGGVTDERELTELENSFRQCYDRQGWKMSTCYPEVPSVLQALNDAGFRLFIVTNKPLHISAMILDRLDIARQFETVVTRVSHSHEFPNKKAMLDFLTITYGVDPATSTFVGDTEEDADAAAACGARFAFVSHGYGRIAKNRSIPVHYRADTFLELYQLLAAGVCP